MITVAAGNHSFRLSVLSGTLGEFTPSLKASNIAEGLDLIEVRMTSEKPEVPPAVSLHFTHPVSDIHGFWHPTSDRNRGFKADWMRKLSSNAATSAPVACLFNINGQNRLAFAF